MIVKLISLLIFAVMHTCLRIFDYWLNKYINSKMFDIYI